jgi:hypothetical protein
LGHDLDVASKILDLYLSYIRPIFWGYGRGYPPKIWPEKWYSTSILGAGNSHSLYDSFYGGYNMIYI